MPEALSVQENLLLIYAIIGYLLLPIGIFEAWLGTILVRRGGKTEKARLSAGMVALSSALFCLSTGAAYLLASWEVDNVIYALAYRSTWSGWFVTVACLQLVFYLDDPESAFARWAGFVLWPAWVASYLLVLTTDIFGAHATTLIPYVAESGPLEMPARIVGGATIFLAMAKCAHMLFRVSGYKRLQLSFLITGLLLFGLTGFLIAAGFQLMGIISVDPALSSFGSLPWVALTFYAINKYRLFDIRFTIIRIVAGFIGVAAVTLLYTLLYMLLKLILAPQLAMILAFAVLAVFFVGVSPFPARIERAFHFLADKNKRYQKLVTETVQAIISILDLKELVSYLTASVKECLQVDRIALLMPEKNGGLRIFHNTGFPLTETGMPEFKKLRERIEKTGALIVLMEEKERLPADVYEGLNHEMAALGAHVAVPLIFRSHINGVLTLGEKIGGAAFVQEDFNAMETLAGQAAVALENARLYRMATTDGLTGLYHQSYFRDRLAEEMHRSSRYGLDLTLIMLDIDHFKQFNDSHGHLAGDKTLKRVAQTIAQHIRESDIAARYGGEEFAVILPETDPDSGYRLAERLRKTVESISVNGNSVTISLGVGSFQPDPDASLESFIQQVDQALYAAKHHGRNQVYVSDA